MSITTPEQDEIIRRCWEHNTYGHHAAKRAVQLTGLKRSTVERRAVELGLVFTRDRYRWTEPELRVVELHAHESLETIQRKLRFVSPPGVKRTRAAIAGQIYQQRFRTNLDGLNHGPLAEALGISRDRLHKLREGKFIKGERLESLRQAQGYAGEIRDEYRYWFYRNEDIVRFLFACRGELDLRKVNQVWLMGLLESYITLFQVTPRQARRAERERTKLAHRRQSKQRKTKPGSTNTSRPSLGDPALDAIRAGQKVLVRRGRRSTGAVASPPASTAAGENSKPSGGVSVKSSIGSGAATSRSASLYSGSAGERNAASLIDGQATT